MSEARERCVVRPDGMRENAVELRTHRGTR